ncbi:MAG: selenide, water dikinase SelD [Bacteroidetes bacterium]|nr:selenide, water dikinase SelD [Bacteroidota bacterium]
MLLTQYSGGAGCGSKIAPAVWIISWPILLIKHRFPDCCLGNEERDDAAVFDLGDGTAVISTTDFYACYWMIRSPLVGLLLRMRSVNIYAMGGTPLIAIAILGWPVNVLSAEVAASVIEGSRKTCLDAGIPLAGGRSIDSPEPIFGLAVTGRVKASPIKRNGGAQVGARYKPNQTTGNWHLSTFKKQNKLLPEHRHLGPEWMLQLNQIGQFLALYPVFRP